MQEMRVRADTLEKLIEFLGYRPRIETSRVSDVYLRVWLDANQLIGFHDWLKKQDVR